MSVKAVTWALEQEISDPVSHLLLVNLADYADKEHKCFPSQELLSKRLSRSVDTVQRHLRKLEKSKHIATVYRSDGRGHRTSNLYILNVDVVVGVIPLASDAQKQPKPHTRGLGKEPPKPQNPYAQTAKKGRLNRTQDAVGTFNHQIEPSEKISKSDLKSEVRPGAHRPAITLTPLDTSWKHWLAHLHATGNGWAAEAAAERGSLIVHSRWPKREKVAA